MGTPLKIFITKNYKPVKLLSSLTLIALFQLAVHGVEKRISNAVSKIDSLLDAGYKKNGVIPNPTINDSTFVRRVYLNIAGRIPTFKEAEAFVRSREKSKRSKLIDELLDSEGYVSHQFNWWADILRINTRMNGQVASNGTAYANWVKSAIRENTPYDRFVRELITAQGMIEENGAVGFYLRDRGMELDHLATTVQVFLGTQLVCAQCHDHPFDDWTQLDYYQLAAFSTPVKSIRTTHSMDLAMNLVKKEIKQSRGNKRKNENVKRNKSKELGRTFRAMTDNFRNSIIGETSAPLKLPHDYQYDDAKPNQVILPATPFGESVKLNQGQSRIQAYADWMTSPKNPRFTKTIANRMWKRVFGVGLYEPVDKIDKSTKASNPDLLTYLEKLMIELNYDLKEFYRVLYNSKAFACESQSYELNSGDTFNFQGPRMRRLSAEQIWDSVVFMIRPDADFLSEDDKDVPNARIKAWERLQQQTPEALLERQKELSVFLKRTEKKMNDFRLEVDKVIKQKNSREATGLVRKISHYNSTVTSEYARLTYWDPADLKRYFRTPFRNTPRALVSQLRQAFPGEKLPNEKTIYETNGLKKPQNKKQKIARNNNKNRKEDLKNKQLRMFREFQRASELSSPAPDGHFLRKFGQSDRSLIENANVKASTTQALSLMNGKHFGMLMNPNSVFSQEIKSAEDSDSMIDTIYLSVLSRYPTLQEKSLLRDEIAVSGDDAPRSIVWALLNTQQFLFVQ